MTSSTAEIGKSIQAMGLATNYHDYGEGQPIVLLHGSGPGVSAWANWRGTIPVLAEHFRVIAVDMAGYGYTELDENAAYSMDYWVDHLREFLDALGIDKASFVGNSFGGSLATTFTVRYPERVERLAVMGANLVDFQIPEALDKLGWGYTPSLDKMRTLLRTFAYDKSLINEEMVQGRYEASNRAGYREAFAAMFPEPRQAIQDAWALSDEELQKIQCPMLLIHGREDPFVPVDVSFRVCQQVPLAQFHMFGQCGHWVQVEHAKRFFKLLLEFFSESQADNNEGD